MRYFRQFSATSVAGALLAPPLAGATAMPGPVEALKVAVTGPGWSGTLAPMCKAVATLKDLGPQFKQLPDGWSFRTKVPDQDLTVESPNHLDWVTQDEFLNAYQGCRDGACNYRP